MSDRKVALVTGASQGIGYHLSIEFAKRGYYVFSCSRKVESMNELVNQFPNQIFSFSMDISSIESIKNGYKFVNEKLIELKISGIDVLYNNAGSSCTFPGIDVPDNALVQCLDTNFVGHVRVVHEFSRLVIAKQGTIAFTGSCAGYCPFPWGSVYGASKAAIGQYASILAFELEPFNVSVKNFITGGVKTDIADKRSLPEDSIYNIEPMRIAFEKRQKMSENHHPMEPSLYAIKAIDSIENGWRSTVDVYLGTWSILPRLCAIFPRFLILYIFRIKFHLNSLFDAISSSKKHD
ncbi:NADPH-dependent 1-acyl dihydroxyacetone phosphate reductase [Pichia californica]|uniref:NADPH-dependent 1-acyl dihydroxyacetone phosphate reductase n=1 Tax=Pichia californica TaxID=460514 RepID=A0A9P7BE60_9ASCO|nr:NADPH-dependent 1-acyl dihydroxyacetone phosphate reductase [[Candida] californica]KAG0687556.1 NADPH-dependent 1-acyl dihydroxyacetone phosphate reductase [[Candida] californica]